MLIPIADEMLSLHPDMLYARHCSIALLRVVMHQQSRAEWTSRAARPGYRAYGAGHVGEHRRGQYQAFQSYLASAGRFGSRKPCSVLSPTFPTHRVSPRPSSGSNSHLGSLRSALACLQTSLPLATSRDSPSLSSCAASGPVRMSISSATALKRHELSSGTTLSVSADPSTSTCTSASCTPLPALDLAGRAEEAAKAGVGV